MDENQLQQLMKMIGIGGGMGTAAGGLMSLFGNQKNPADAANKRLSGIPGQARQYYEPYMQAGQGALSDLRNQYKDLLSGNTQAKLGAGFQESPGYQFKLQQALNAGNNAMAAGGMLGSRAHEQGSMQLGHDISNQDYQQYLENQMGLYGQGLSGEQGLNQMGYNANTGFGDLQSNVAQQQAAFDYAGQAGKNQRRSTGLSDLLGGLGMAGGALFGGPAGATAGGGIMSMLSKLFGKG